MFSQNRPNVEVVDDHWEDFFQLSTDTAQLLLDGWSTEMVQKIPIFKYLQLPCSYGIQIFAMHSGNCHGAPANYCYHFLTSFFSFCDWRLS